MPEIKGSHVVKTARHDALTLVQPPNDWTQRRGSPGVVFQRPDPGCSRIRSSRRAARMRLFGAVAPLAGQKRAQSVLEL